MKPLLVSIAALTLACATHPQGATNLASERELDPQQREMLLSSCEKLWPNDYRMQERCLERQAEGLRDVMAYVEKHDLSEDSTSPEALILGSCADEWDRGDEGFDWLMISRCVEQQMPAYRRLHPDD